MGKTRKTFALYKGHLGPSGPKSEKEFENESESMLRVNIDYTVVAEMIAELIRLSPKSVSVTEFNKNSRENLYL